MEKAGLGKKGALSLDKKEVARKLEKTPEELAEADRRLKTLRWVVSIFGSAVVGYFLMKFFKSRSWAVEFLKARRKRLEGAFGGPAQPPQSAYGRYSGPYSQYG